MASLLVKVFFLLFATSLLAFIPRPLPPLLPFPERLPEDINAANHTLIATLFSSKVASHLYPQEITVFAPPDVYLVKNPYYNLSMLLHEYVAPSCFPYHHLQYMVANYKSSYIRSGNLDRCIQIDSAASNSTIIFINERVELTHPDLLFLHNGRMLVHGLGGSSFPLRYNSCHGSSDFPLRPPGVSPAMSIMRVMVWDIIITARTMGYTHFAKALQNKYDAIVRLKYMTIFAVRDKDLETTIPAVLDEDFEEVLVPGKTSRRILPGNKYLKYFWGNVVPDHYLLAKDLARLGVGTELPTLSPDRKKLIVTGKGAEINSTRVSNFHILKNARIVVHRIPYSFACPQPLSLEEKFKFLTGGWGEFKEVTFTYDFPPY